MRELFRRYDDAFEEISLEPEQIIEFDDSLVIRLAFRALGKESGVEVEQRMWQAARIRDDKVAWWQMFHCRAEALAAIGQSE